MTRINARSRPAGFRPVVFTTLVNADIRETVRKADAFVLDFFESFLDPLEAEFGAKSTHTIGRSHSARDEKGYTHRIDAINFALAHDDGASSKDLDKADVILVGVSRSGKTPTSLYLSLQFGIRAANCPLIPEDFDRMSLPKALEGYRKKLLRAVDRARAAARDPQRTPPQQQVRRPGELPLRGAAGGEADAARGHTAGRTRRPSRSRRSPPRSCRSSSWSGRVY